MNTQTTISSLLESEVEDDPIVQFQHWYAAARAAPIDKPDAATLATADAQGHPAARIVLLKDVDAQGFVFYTNYQSRKGRELAQNPWAALVFFWDPLARQVRIEGQVSRVSDAESDAYFTTRPRGSQLGAWASAQSEVVAKREHLEQAMARLSAEYEGKPVPRPGHWGGYRLYPQDIEFWQGRDNRLHDRLHYHREPAGQWSRQRLAP